MEATDSDAAARIINAAVVAMTEKGYHATSVREIADLAGVSIATLYHHFGSKEQLLAEIMQRGTRHLLALATTALDDAGSDPVRRFKAVIGVLVERHLKARREAFLGSTELRSLAPEDRATIVKLRDRFQGMLISTVKDGVDAGVFTTAYPKEAVRGVITMCNAVAGWYREGGELSVEEIVARYQEICLSAVGYAVAADSSERRPA